MRGDPVNLPQPDSYPEQPELAVAALLYLMTRFSIRPCRRKADAIVHHFELVAADDRLPSELRRAAGRLETVWRAMTAPPGAGSADTRH